MVPGLCFLAFYAVGITLALSLSVPPVMFVGQPCLVNWTRGHSDPPSFVLQAQKIDSPGTGQTLPFSSPPVNAGQSDEGSIVTTGDWSIELIGHWIISAVTTFGSNNSVLATTQCWHPAIHSKSLKTTSRMGVGVLAQATLHKRVVSRPSLFQEDRRRAQLAMVLQYRLD
ncbi:hypothetical protein C8J56DRAFT_960581 [Mycena floridula]|nr:hypothetical protein C8J56DRAFT_960581 [Mycena floridula]